MYGNNGIMYMLQKDESWRTDRYRNLLYIINREIGSYIRAGFNYMRDRYRRVGPFGMWRFKVRGNLDGTLPLNPTPFRGRCDGFSQMRKMEQISHVDTKIEDVGVAIVTGLKRPDPGLLIGLDINTVKAFIIKAFWKEVRPGLDNFFIIEILFDKKKSNLPSYRGIQWFCLTPHNLFWVKVEFNSMSQLRLRGCADSSNIAFFNKGSIVGDIAHSAVMTMVIC